MDGRPFRLECDPLTAGQSELRWLFSQMPIGGGMSDVSFVYCLRRPDNHLVKIGITTNLRERYRALCSEERASLEILWVAPGGREHELSLHEMCDDRRVRGEWFSLSYDDAMDVLDHLVYHHVSEKAIYDWEMRQLGAPD